jgi:glycosyltransferase involved in cell wall biosynthesis
MADMGARAARDGLGRPRRSFSPRVTIGLPVHNGENFLEETLRSLLAQTYEDWELIVSDNASSDRTEEICRAYAREDPRIRFFRQRANLGAAPNFNFVFGHARGEYFKWATHDDVVSPTYIEQCLELLDRSPDLVLSFPRVTYIDDDGAVLRRQAQANLTIRAESPADRVRRLVDLELQGSDIFWAIFGLIRSSTLRTTQLMGSYVASDQVLLLELALRGSFFQVPEDLYRRRDHQSASMRAHKTPQARAKWFDSSNDARVVWAQWAMLSKHMAAVHAARLPTTVKWRCYLAVLRRFLRQWRNLAGELKIVGRDVARIVFTKRRYSS